MNEKINGEALLNLTEEDIKNLKLKIGEQAIFKKRLLILKQANLPQNKQENPKGDTSFNATAQPGGNTFQATTMNFHHHGHKD